MQTSIISIQSQVVPALLILHRPDRKENFWVKARQEFRTNKASGNKVVIPKSNNFMAAAAEDS